MKACCQLAETLVTFLLLQQLREDFHYYFSCWLVLQHVFNILFRFRIFAELVLALKNRVCPKFTVLNIYFLLFRIFEQIALALKTEFALKIFKPEGGGRPPAQYGNAKIGTIGRNCISTLRYP